MFSDLLQRNSFINYSCYSLSLLLLWGANLFWGQHWNIPVAVDEYRMPLQQLIALLHNHGDYTLTALLGLIVCGATGILLSRINYTNLFLSGKRDYLLPFLFVFLSSVFYTGRLMLHVYLATFCCVLAYHYLFNTYRQSRPYGDLFIAACCISVASLLYAPAIVFIIPLFIGMGVMKGFDWRDWAMAIFGVIAPYFYAQLAYTLLGNDLNHVFLLTKNCLVNFHVEHLVFHSDAAYAFLLFVLLLEVLAVPVIIVRLQRMKIKAMRINIIILITYVVCLVAFFSIISTGKEFVGFIALPASLLLTNLFACIKKQWVFNLLLSLFFLLLIAVQFFPE